MRKEIDCSQITGFKGSTGHWENHSNGKTRFSMEYSDVEFLLLDAFKKRLDKYLSGII